MASPTSQSMTVAKRKASDALVMPPPPLPLMKRQKRPAKVLDEDVYNSAVSHIIARDFFPGLLEAEAQEDYLNALDSNDSAWIREAGRRVKDVMTPGPEQRRMRRAGTRLGKAFSASVTPRGYAGETPRTERAESHFAAEEPDGEGRKERVDVNMSIRDFQAKYTSEDNESFNALLDKQNTKRAEKYAFLAQGNKIPTARQIAYRERQQQLIESGRSTTALIRTNAAGEKLRALAPDGGPSAALDARPASLDSFPNRQGARNHFMFGPDGLEDSGSTEAQQREATSTAPPKSVSYASTRLPGPVSTSSAAVPQSPSLSAIDAAIAGRPRPTETESGYPGAETPRVNGYAFVDAEPTPSELGLPVDDAEAEAAEREEIMALMPKAESGAPNPFRINERSAREDLRDRLVEKSDAARRKGGAGGGLRVAELRRLGITPGGGRTPTPRFTSAPKGSGKAGMTPAARMLANSLTPVRRAAAFEQRNAWTPTPRVKRAG